MISYRVLRHKIGKGDGSRAVFELREPSVDLHRVYGAVHVQKQLLDLRPRQQALVLCIEPVEHRLELGNKLEETKKRTARTDETFTK